jgi:hypothetical protein
MKGKLELRFIAPNVSKLRSRVENPSKDLSAQVRSIINEAVAEVAESNQYELKAKILKKVAAMEASGAIKFNNPQHRAQVFDITGDIFSTAFTATAEEFEKRFPSDEKTEKKPKAEKKEEAPAEEAAGDAPGDEFSE